MILLVQQPGAYQPIRYEPAMLRDALSSGALHAEVLASADNGATWWPAWQVAGYASPGAVGGGMSALGMVVPTGRFSGWAMAAGYFGILLLAFGLPIAIVVAATAKGKDAWPVIAFIGGPLVVLGCLPVAGMSALGHRALRRDASLKGIGRAIFGYVSAGAVTFVVLIAALLAIFGR
jgi:hypothetical protein